MKRNHEASHPPKENIGLLWDWGKGWKASKKEAIVSFFYRLKAKQDYV